MLLLAIGDATKMEPVEEHETLSKAPLSVNNKGGDERNRLEVLETSTSSSSTSSSSDSSGATDLCELGKICASGAEADYQIRDQCKPSAWLDPSSACGHYVSASNTFAADCQSTETQLYKKNPYGGMTLWSDEDADHSSAGCCNYIHDGKNACSDKATCQTVRGIFATATNGLGSSSSSATDGCPTDSEPKAVSTSPAAKTVMADFRGLLAVAVVACICMGRL